MATIRVKAAAGMRFPREGDTKNYITSEPVAVQSSAYYRRALADGDLVLVNDATEKAVAAPATVAQTDADATGDAVVKTTKKVS